MTGNYKITDAHSCFNCKWALIIELCDNDGVMRESFGECTNILVPDKVFDKDHTKGGIVEEEYARICGHHKFTSLRQCTMSNCFSSVYNHKRCV